MRLGWPLALAALLLVPLALAGYLAIERRAARYAVHFTNVEVLAGLPSHPSRRRTWIPTACALLSLSCALAALSRPELEISSATEGASIVLVVDVSGSMAADDVEPTRLTAADHAIEGFLAVLPPRYRIGLVTFSDEPHVASPLTRDRARVLEALRWTNPGHGTAIGDALARSVQLLGVLPASDGAPPANSGSAAGALPSAIVLLSDGAQTDGALSPLAGAAQARRAGIPVYTIALGTTAGAVWQGVIRLAVPPDGPILRRIARTTGGTFARSTSEARLDAVYGHLASRLTRRTQWHEVSFVLVGVAALCALVAGVLSLAWGYRLP